MEIIKICGFSLLALAAITVVKQFRSEFGATVRTAVSAVFLGVIVSLCIPIYSYISELAKYGSVSSYSEIILKGIGIAFVVKVCSNICTDMGENTIAGYVETIGRLELTVLAIPLVEKIVSVIRELL